MKTIIISDLHLGQFWKSNNSCFSRSRKMIQYLKKNLEFFIEAYPEDKLTLIIGGDVFNAVQANTEMLVHVVTELKDSLDKFEHIHCIAGNHETFIDRNGVQQSLLTIAMTGSNVTIYDKGVHTAQIGNINYIFVPFQNNQEDLINNLDNYFHPTLNNAIIAHMTPKEIFSFNTFQVNPIIDYYTKEKGFDVPYVLLGHYHATKVYKHKSTMVVSIGNTYYTSIEDIKDAISGAQKRYLMIDDRARLFSAPLILPKIVTYEVESQTKFELMIPTIEKDNTDTDNIIHIKSPTLIDYSVLMTSGFDVYFDLQKSEDDSLLAINECAKLDINDATSNMGRTLEERWDKYISSIPDKMFTNTGKKLANLLFTKRNDADLTTDNLYNMILAMVKEDKAS